MDKEFYFEKAIAWIQRKSITSLRASIEGYDMPKVFVNQNTQEKIQPDLSFVTENGAKHYLEIVLKNACPDILISKLKLLSVLAAHKNGKLHLLAPKGHKSFAEKLIEKHKISAKVYSI